MKRGISFHDNFPWVTCKQPPFTVMKKSIESILNDPKIIEFPKSSRVKQLIGIVNHFSEAEFNNFIEEFGQVSGKLNATNRSQELFEFICKERESYRNLDTRIMNDLSIKNSATPTFQNGNSCSYINSPEKQLGDKSNGGGTRWIVSREERRKILEQMERYREDQKRLRKQDWCRLTRLKSEFEELWENDGDGLRENDLIKMKIDEGIEIVKAPESVKAPELVKAPESKRSRQQFEDNETRKERSSTQDHTDYQIVDFDCIENLLIYLKNDRSSSSSSSSANFILSCADHIYRSELMFYNDLKEFDQPYFLYYGNDDNLCPLKHYEFYNDELGNYARNRPYNDKSKKFYQERAFRHRYISRKPYELFFNDFAFKRLRDEVENLDKNCKEFHFWLSKTIAKKGSIFVSSGPLLRSFSLLLVLSRLVQLSTFDISNSIWSHGKYGTEWTLQEISNNHQGKVGYLTHEKSSKLSIEAARLGIKFI